MTSDDIIKRLGGTAAVARLCECSPQAVSQWMGTDADGKQRSIPKARELHLKAIRPDAFIERRASRTQKRGE
jgi:DNA-binding transcriptional regulator YdaS (Cro superfamily)